MWKSYVKYFFNFNIQKLQYEKGCKNVSRQDWTDLTVVIGYEGTPDFFSMYNS